MGVFVKHKCPRRQQSPKLFIFIIFKVMVKVTFGRVCETLRYDPGGNKVQKAIFSFNVKVKVRRSLTLVSFGRASLVEYVCQI